MSFAFRAKRPSTTAVYNNNNAKCSHYTCVSKYNITLDRHPLTRGISCSDVMHHILFDRFGYGVVIRVVGMFALYTQILFDRRATVYLSSARTMYHNRGSAIFLSSTHSDTPVNRVETNIRPASRTRECNCIIYIYIYYIHRQYCTHTHTHTYV